MNQDAEHLRLLSVFHYVVGGLTALFSCLPLVHVAIGIVMLAGAFDGKNAPPRAVGLMFTLVGGIAILCGWTLAACIIIAGRRLAQHRSWLYCLVVAALECMITPFGTVLGVFTIIVLLRESVKRLFGQPVAAADVPSADAAGPD